MITTLTDSQGNKVRNFRSKSSSASEVKLNAYLLNACKLFHNQETSFVIFTEHTSLVANPIALLVEVSETSKFFRKATHFDYAKGMPNINLDSRGQIDYKPLGVKKHFISTLITKQLATPLEIIVEPDDEGMLARTIDIPLYGYGDDTIEAIRNLKSEIESLYADLLEDDNFTDEWLNIKKLLKSIII